MAQAKRSITPVVYQIKITLKGSKPPIWRRMQVTSTTTLAQLHQILQCVMGWEGYHLYRFDISGMEYGDPSMVEEMEGEDARRVVPVQLMKTGITLPLEIPSRRQEGETGLLCRAERLHGQQWGSPKRYAFVALAWPPPSSCFRVSRDPPSSG